MKNYYKMEKQDRCEFCNTLLTKKLIELSNKLYGEPCDCSFGLEILELRKQIKCVKNKISYLIRTKTDGEEYSEVVKSDLEDLIK